jgi:hypothetical protein
VKATPGTSVLLGAVQDFIDTELAQAGRSHQVLVEELVALIMLATKKGEHLIGLGEPGLALAGNAYLDMADKILAVLATHPTPTKEPRATTSRHA